MSATALSAEGPRTGCFGKLPGRGDFLRRDLDGGFVARWDGWLAGALAAGREALGPDWTELYLTAPVWCFLIGRQAAGGAAVAGVLCPSADRVGRLYPLTVAAPLAEGAAPGARPWADWFERAVESTVAAVEERLDPQAFFERLSGFGLPRLPDGGAGVRLDPAAPLDPAALAPALVGGDAGLWWSAGSESLYPATLIVPGALPAPAAFAALIDGDWAGHGWTLAGEGAR